MAEVYEGETISPEELAKLRLAKWDLEHPSLAIRLTNLVGIPVEKGLKMLPKGWANILNRSVHGALRRALRLMVYTLPSESSTPASEVSHRWFVGSTGALGGAFGLASLPFELPISTTAMLRSIADIARSEGHSLKDAETRVACLEVFALGGRPQPGSEKDNHYWVVRTGLAKAVGEATAYLANRGVVKETAPAMVRLVAAVASRFGVVVTEQAAAKAIPVVGAASGSVINLVFMRHFQRMARAHFVVKSLEKKYGSEEIEALYRSVAMPTDTKEVAGEPIREV